MKYLVALLMLYSTATSEATMGDYHERPFDEESWACLPTDVEEGTCGDLHIDTIRDRKKSSKGKVE